MQNIDRHSVPDYQRPPEDTNLGTSAHSAFDLQPPNVTIYKESSPQTRLAIPRPDAPLRLRESSIYGPPPGPPVLIQPIEALCWGRGRVIFPV